MKEDQPLVRVQEACALLSVNEKTLRLMISRGTLPAVRLGPKTTRFRREDIDGLTNPPPTLFSEARAAAYSELNRALGRGDLAAARTANAANKWLSCARDDIAAGEMELAKTSAQQAARLLPKRPELAAYGDSL